MSTLLRCLHQLCVALWFGSVAFFTIAGLLIFNAFADQSRLEASERPLWFPLPAVFDQPSPGPGFSEPLRLEQGSRAAGVAVSRIFPVYYGLQVVCGIVVLFTIPSTRTETSGEQPGVSRPVWRTLLACVALGSVLAGWWLELRVADLREPRNQLTDEVLASEHPAPSLLERAQKARANFARWHGYSLVQNFVTLILTTGLTLSLAGPGTSRRS